MKKSVLFTAAVCCAMLAVPFTVSAEYEDDEPEVFEEYVDPNETVNYINVTGTTEEGMWYELFFDKTKNGGLEYSGCTTEEVSEPLVFVPDGNGGYELMIDGADRRIKKEEITLADNEILVEIPFGGKLTMETENGQVRGNIDGMKYYIVTIDGENSTLRYAGIDHTSSTDIEMFSETLPDGSMEDGTEIPATGNGNRLPAVMLAAGVLAVITKKRK